MAKFTHIVGISDTTRKRLLAKSAYGLPDTPTALGWKPDSIKSAMYQFVLSQGESIYTEINRIVGQTNTAIATVEETSDNAIKGITERIDGVDTRIDKIVDNTTKISNVAGGGSIGTDSEATTGFAGGNGAKATADGSVQLGQGTNAEANTLQFSSHKIADGDGKLYSKDSVVANQDTVESIIDNTTVIGNPDYNTVLRVGYGASGTDGVVIGRSASASSETPDTTGYFRCVAIGDSSQAHDGGISIGSATSRDGSIVIGNDSQTQNGKGIVIGQSSSGNGEKAIAIGDATKSHAADGISVGCESKVEWSTCVGGIAIGTQAKSSARGAIAIGKGAEAAGDNAVQLGKGRNITRDSLQCGAHRIMGAKGDLWSEDKPIYNGEQSDARFVKYSDNATTSKAGIVQIAQDSDAEENADRVVPYALMLKAIQNAIAELGNGFDLKGTVKTKADLPQDGNIVGDVWFVLDESVGYVWLDKGNVKEWEQFGKPFDTSAYYTKDDIDRIFGQIDLGNIRDGLEFDIPKKLVEEMFQSHAKVVTFTWSNNWTVYLRIVDRSPNIVYYSANLQYKDINYRYSLAVDKTKTTKNGLLIRTESAPILELLRPDGTDINLTDGATFPIYGDATYKKGVIEVKVFDKATNKYRLFVKREMSSDLKHLEFVETLDTHINSIIIDIATRTATYKSQPILFEVKSYADGKVTLGGGGRYEAIATSSRVGMVKPDNDTITIDGDGTIHGQSKEVWETWGSEADNKPPSNLAVGGIFNKLFIKPLPPPAYLVFTPTGNGECSVRGKDVEFATSVDIPASVFINGETYTVTAIENNGFQFQPMFDVRMPNTVTSIGSEAFYGCHDLRMDSHLFTVLPKNLKTIGARAFYNCEGRDFLEVTIPDGVTTIEEHTFASCTNLEKVSLHKNITYIASFAFAQCTALETIEFDGTIAQWKALYKGDGWSVGVPAQEVRCSDGMTAIN